jgi:cell division protein FtsB
MLKKIQELRNKNLWEQFLENKHFRILRWCVGTAFVIFLVAAFYFPNYAKLNKISQTNATLVSDIKALRQEIADLKSKLKKVKKDDTIYESVARESLGEAREGEIVIDMTR